MEQYLSKLESAMINIKILSWNYLFRTEMFIATLIDLMCSIVLDNIIDNIIHGKRIVDLVTQYM